MARGYRPNVGMMIINKEGLVWMGLRIKSEGQAYRFQMPQGGIDKGETPLTAVYREMREETGLKPSDVRLVTAAKKWYKYDLPENVRRKRSIRGQRQKWFLFLLTGSEKKINLTTDTYQEFVGYEWMKPDAVIEKVVPFKQDVYRQVVAEFEPYIQKMKQAA